MKVSYSESKLSVMMEPEQKLEHMISQSFEAGTETVY